MGSSKTAQALMCKFNYEQKGFKVNLFKPVADNRKVVDGKAVVSSRIGLTTILTLLIFVLKTNLLKKMMLSSLMNANF